MDKSIEQLKLYTKQPTCISETSSINDAIAMVYPLWSNIPIYRHLIITETGANDLPCKGIVSLRDLDRNWTGIRSGRRSLNQSGVMTPFNQSVEKFRYLHPRSSVADALYSFITPISGRGARHYISAMPVLKSDSFNVVGIISYVDILLAIKDGRISLSRQTVEAIMTHLIPDPDKEQDIAYDDYTFNDIAVLVKNKGRRTIPVINERGQVLGLITDRKVFSVLWRGNNLDIPITDPLLMIPASELRLALASEIINDVIDGFLDENKTDALLVIDDKGLLAGILSYVDIFARCLLNTDPDL